ncbi:MAG: DUF1761 domain-containing protein [Proteobacteria bacterium]|nr:DUF1761 domain-containing protein [Pseudomonadota bacterium]MDA0992097.1 DUF1761 domain-containing protein [Pseudomonadota bacterium]
MPLAQILSDVNWFAVVTATAAAFMLGGLWYSKSLFGKAWMQEVGLTEQAIGNANMVRTFGGTIILQALSATALSAFLGADSTWQTGLQAGLWVGLFWIATAYGVTYLFEQRSLRLFFINAGYYVVLYAVAGTIIGAWR